MAELPKVTNDLESVSREDEEAIASISAKVTQVRELEAALQSLHALDANCSLCGQTLPQETREQRIVVVQEDLRSATTRHEAIVAHRHAVLHKLTQTRAVKDELNALSSTTATLQGLHDGVRELDEKIAAR